MRVAGSRFCASRALAAPLLVLACSTGLAADLNPQERLEALRNGLVQQALRGATEVQTTTWIDAQGSLREASSFRTGMQVRGVRVVSYGRDELGQPQARLQVEANKDLLKPAAKPASCDSRDRLRHVLGLQFQVGGRWSVDDLHLLREANALLSQTWADASAAAARWTLAELPAAPVQRLRTSAEIYEQVLTGGAATSPEVPWHLKVSLESLPSADDKLRLPWRDSASTRVRLHMALQSPREKAPALQNSVELSFEAQQSNWSAPRLSNASRAQLQALVQAWARAVTERLACEPVQTQVQQAGPDRLQIDQGALAGVQAGDEWLVSDRRRWPARALEKDAAASLVLARVERVSAHQAQLQVLAGPASTIKPQWQAWPVVSP